MESIASQPIWQAATMLLTAILAGTGVLWCQARLKALEESQKASRVRVRSRQDFHRRR